MPKETKKRGRRAVKARQDEEAARQTEEAYKSGPAFFEDTTGDAAAGADAAETAYGDGADGTGEPGAAARQQAFYGLLDPTQLDYFRQADQQLAVPAFETDEEKDQFCNAVWAEMDRIELKVATDQAGSKLLERLITLAPSSRLRTVFGTFSGHYEPLFRHRYASHCCEALLRRIQGLLDYEDAELAAVGPDEAYVSMENMVLFIYNELKPNILDVAFDPYGTHGVRILLLTLTGQAAAGANSSLVRSKRSQKTRKNELFEETAFSAPTAGPANLPESFREPVESFVKTACKALDSEQARHMVFDPVCSPVLQLLLGITGKKKKYNVLRILFPDADWTSSTLSFVNAMATDPAGSRFLERILETCDSSFLDQTYREYFVARLDDVYKYLSFPFLVGALVARLDTAAADGLVAGVLPKIRDLGQTNLDLLAALIAQTAERDLARDGVTDRILELAAGEDSAADSVLFQLLDVTADSLGSVHDGIKNKINPIPVKRALLVQSLVGYTPAATERIVESFIALPVEAMLKFARHTIYSHVVEKIMTCDSLTTLQKRRVLNGYVGHFGELASEPSGSRVVDAAAVLSAGMNHYREKIAGELAERRADIQNSLYGRKVWKNWKMDIYVNRPGRWNSFAKPAAAPVRQAPEKKRQPDAIDEIFSKRRK
ncbi:armadillo-type protein [Dipodascopsis tothii]|uniref:armadillo-type protein n=1 Tax=Dipodascopsis tothii TaxID=44089 RepID=UPI0034CDB847